MDRILIQDLLIRCTIGVDAEERREKEDVVMNISLACDLREPGKSDEISDTIDYRALKKRVVAMVEKSRYSLIEALAERVASVCLATPGVIEAHIRVEKPSALRFARSVGVEITRRAGEQAVHEVFLGLGSNIEPEKNILRSIEHLMSQVQVTAASGFYRTQPMGGPDGPPFVNGVIKIETEILPLDLKSSILRPIEEKLGRVRTADKNAPRTIDLDLLIYGDLTIKQDDLTVPDPDISEREFLAVPLAELAPDHVLPGSDKNLRDFAKKLNGREMEFLQEYTELIRKKLERPR